MSDRTIRLIFWAELLASVASSAMGMYVSAFLFAVGALVMLVRMTSAGAK